MIGFSVWTHQVEQVTLVTNRLRNELGALMVWGGIHPTSYPEDAVRAVDAICMGEGDVSFLKLVQAVEEGRDYRKTRRLLVPQRAIRSSAIRRASGGEPGRNPVHGF